MSSSEEFKFCCHLCETVGKTNDLVIYRGFKVCHTCWSERDAEQRIDGQIRAAEREQLEKNLGRR